MKQIVFVALAAVLWNAESLFGAPVGIFSDQQDVGAVAQAGSARADAGVYQVSGGGANMWSTNDAFHFVWKEVSGDVALAATINWPKQGGDAHRKACLVIRQSLAPDSPYVDAALHASGLTSLQFRETPGGLTHEIMSSVSAPTRLRIEKQGDYLAMSISSAGESLHSAGGTVRMTFKAPFYVGLGVCAHDNKTSETAEFSQVELTVPAPLGEKPALESTLEVIGLQSKDRRVVYQARDHFEAPNWSRDGSYFLFNSHGHICRILVTGGQPAVVTTGSVQCNNDHGISPDGTQLAISGQSEDTKSRVCLLPIGGGTPRQVTPLAPSYWHGWSPDGQTLTYCGERNGEFDIYTIPAAGGQEKRLTTAPGLDDGPEYSPDGKYIYFNSERGGLMQIWRMKPDGSEQEAVTADGYNNWFAHPSPDGKWLVFLSFPKEVKGHPANKDVMLRLMPAGKGEIEVLARFFGGQGTINVPSWSPDSKSVAFVSYRLVEP